MALERVREDKEREAGDGFDGTWVAHPDLVPVATEIFDRVLGDRPNQKDRQREDVPRGAARRCSASRSRAARSPRRGCATTSPSACSTSRRGCDGLGAVAIYNLMEDAATAEISRAQLWQWIHRGAALDDGRPVTAELYAQVRDEELGKLGGGGRLPEAAELLDQLVLAPEFREFLTLPAYERLP